MQSSPGYSLSFTQSPGSSTTQNPGSISISDLYEPYQTLMSPGSAEVSSDIVIKKNDGEHFNGVEGTGVLGTETELNVSEALRRLEEQLSLNDDGFKEFDLQCNQDDDPNELDLLDYKSEISNQDHYANFHGPELIVKDHGFSGQTAILGNPDNPVLLTCRFFIFHFSLYYLK